MRIDLDNGKYTYIRKEDGTQEALRYGEPWRNLLGDNLIYWMSVEIEQLQAKNAELEKEVERLKARSIDYETKHDVACLTINQLQEKCEVRGKALMGQCKETKELRQQLAIAEEHNARLQEALQAMVNAAAGMKCGLKIADEALSIPASRETLDAYVAEKVKKETDEYSDLSDRLSKLLAETAVAIKGEEAALTRHSWHDLPVIALTKMVEISELTRQRDLAVSAIENLVKQKGRHNTEIAYKKLVEALAAIKESEV